jgi:hypothetical protein
MPAAVRATVSAARSNRRSAPRSAEGENDRYKKYLQAFHTPIGAAMNSMSEKLLQIFIEHTLI